ncbi:hypothetical protein [Myceligenerans salitolerans]|uniref:Uncharacterized protein n=1 Tax=Myceligenerans salitolerans TaxID=1230528 RepID=A0ABS3IC34_9MICO|nr:hypothetical protein [Myceligenerans salitolerans]MBO0610596.1 hypothetical protein [Myceligenerans salitolerans]
MQTAMSLPDLAAERFDRVARRHGTPPGPVDAGQEPVLVRPAGRDR